MRFKIYYFLFLVFLIGTANLLKAQTPSDALMMEKNELCIALLYQHDTWDEYWEGSLLRENKNIGVLTRNTILPMMAYGITNKFNIIAALPYVTTEASGGQMVGTAEYPPPPATLIHRETTFIFQTGLGHRRSMYLRPQHLSKHNRLVLLTSLTTLE